MSFLFVVIFWLVLSSLISFCLLQSHVLLSLLSLEGCNLGLLMLVLLYFSYQLSESYFYVVYLIFIVCDSVLGLCLLVSLMRGEGNDCVYGLEVLC